MRLIDADALETHWECFADPDLDYEYVLKVDIDNAPTIDPVKHGRWVKLDMHPHLADHKCTACGESAYVPTCMGEPMYLFCPNCGALMREDGGEG